VTAETMPDTRQREPAFIPIGYQTQQVRRRATRPLHSREAILAAAEAVFKPKEGNPTGSGLPSQPVHPAKTDEPDSKAV
jgi:hypothetical protein